MPPRRSFLFLQGPISPFFSEVAAGLRELGHAAHRINLCLGDKLFWHGPGAVDYRGGAEGWPAFVGAFLDRHGITDLVLLGEQRPLHRAAIAEARARRRRGGDGFRLSAARLDRAGTGRHGRGKPLSARFRGHPHPGRTLPRA